MARKIARHSRLQRSVHVCQEVYDELELTFGQCKSDVRALLKKEGIKEPSEEQLEDG